MKTLVLAIALCITSLMQAQESKGVTITIVMDNLLSNEGKASAALYTEATFMKAAPLQATEEAPENKKVTLTFEDVQPGMYGIITLHDLNENGRMDYESNGMPKEPYGISGNEMLMGPPTWESAKFEVGSEDMTITIIM